MEQAVINLGFIKITYYSFGGRFFTYLEKNMCYKNCHNPLHNHCYGNNMVLFKKGEEKVFIVFWFLFILSNCIINIFINL